jgi:hypothetical protein
MRARGAGVAAILLLLAGAGTAQEAKQEEANPPAQTQTAPAPKKPRVFTNKDLEKYARPGTGAQIVRPARPGGPPLEPPPPAPATAPPSPLPPEERLDGATPEELRARELELAARLTYLRGKEAWLRNPFGPPPAPPPGEPVVAPGRTGAQELAQALREIDDLSNRLLTVRSLLGLAPAP